MIFLLFGGAGFIGANLAKYLTERGHRVLVARRRAVAVRPLIKKAIEGLEVFEYDDPREAVVKSRPDVIVNLVAALHGGRKEVWDANVGFPQRLCSALSQAGWSGRLIHISGATVVGPIGTTVKEEEEHLVGIRPATYFDETKAEGERIISKCANNWVIIRPTAVYGPYNDHPEWAKLVDLARRGLAPRLSLSFSAISVSDLSEIVERAVHITARQYFFATQCEPLSFNEVITALEEAAGRRLVKLPMPLALARALAPPSIRGLLKYAGIKFSCEKLRSLLGYEPKYRRDDMVDMFRILWSSTTRL
ncbi:NAD-dependent epimerase/dehydratase family protein [Thermoproteus tenax]|uniref:Nucleoside-diphosphate-sugarepimerase/dehydratase n=1 Tax=Thermoproteus tenax (strain ATCC 35583 / DSM 2078 / JCM 9277 / NBRC 100435 / Kra 1) TaxID=768679 RepID=G4RPQ9_THETK|nr:NAD(P)-dependent oxidoreductase [Thermoproteus tenax]CCC81554.1 nucleoside-diphosphate-sugarepimerase/dehydratase [Thermoproteus tenax Kra 1]